MVNETDTQKQDTTREKLLSAAAELFAEKGRDGVSIRDIAAAAGVRHGGINYHFRSKEELYHEVLMRFGPAAGRTVFQQEIPKNLSPDFARSVFVRILRTLIEHEVEPLDAIATGLMRAEISRPEGPDELLYERVIRPHLEAMAQLIGQMCPELRDPKERTIAAFNIMSQCVFLRVARPVALKLLGAQEFDQELTDLVANRIIESALNGLSSPVRKSQ